MGGGHDGLFNAPIKSNIKMLPPKTMKPEPGNRLSSGVNKLAFVVMS